MKVLAVIFMMLTLLHVMSNIKEGLVVWNDKTTTVIAGIIVFAWWCVTLYEVVK